MNARACPICGHLIESLDWRVRYCGDECRKKKQAQMAKAWAEKNRDRMADAQERFTAKNPHRGRSRAAYYKARYHERRNVVMVLVAIAAWARS